jgi:streptomycin 6-kinase
MSMDRIVVPDELAASHHRYFGTAGSRWVAALPGLAEEFLRRWQLSLDGAPRFGAVALVLPVLRSDRTPAALKLQPVDDETRGEARALTSWAGLGAVALLEQDEASGSMLLERLDASRTLASVEDDLAALGVIAELLRRLNALRAPGGVRLLGDIAARMLEQVPGRLHSLADPAERRLLTVCATELREVASDPVDNSLLHWDLHYDNVLATCPSEGATSWRAIDPKTLSGDPGFELLPALWNRWEDIVATGDVQRAVLRRIDLMTDVLELDRSRARAWTLGRVLQNALWDVGKLGQSAIHPVHRVIAESLLGRDA